MARLIACPACAAHVMARESKCPHCGAKVKADGGAVLGRTAGAVLMGLTLAGCPADDDEGTTTMGNNGSTTMNNGSSGVDPSTGNEVTGGFDSSGPVGEAYGVPDTDTFSGGSTEGDTDSTGSGSDSGSGSGSGSDSGSGTDPGSTGISPDYGVPTSG